MDKKDNKETKDVPKDKDKDTKTKDKKANAEMVNLIFKNLERRR
jgi:hypothetical protein